MTATKTFPTDITKLGRGRAQRAILAALHGEPTGLRLNDMTRGRAFVRLHFAQVMSAGEALAKRGIISITTPEPGFGEVYKLARHSHA